MKEVKKTNKKRKIEEPIIEDDDKRVVVFIAIAVLIIVAVIICLLVTKCTKDEPVDDDTPVKEVEKDKEKEEDKVIKDEEDDEDEKISSITSTVKKLAAKKKYTVSFNLNGKDKYHTVKVTSGDTTKKYTPTGYESCKYFKDKELEKEFDFDKGIKENTTVYMTCSEKEYQIVYNVDTDNQTNYFISDGKVQLDEPYDRVIDENGVLKTFVGWSLSETKYDEVKYLTPSLIKEAKDDTIYLYAHYKSKITVTYAHDNSKYTYDVNEEMTILNPNDNICTEGTLVGWTENEGTNRVTYVKGGITSFDNDITLYPICAVSTVKYTDPESDQEEIIGYDKEDLENFEIPEPEDVNIEIPTYFIPVVNETETTQKVVSDDKEVLEDKEIKVSDVKDKAAENYTPQIDDIVESLEKEFDGWVEEKVDPEDENNTIKEKVEDDFVPEEKTEEIKLEATWKEPVKYEGEKVDNSEEPEL